jgi:hypothetical protein
MAEFTYESEESDEEHDYVYVDRNQFGGTVELQPSNEQNQFFERVCFNLFCNVCPQPENAGKAYFTVRGCPVSLLANEGISLFSSDVCLPSVLVEAVTRPINTCDCKISTLTCRWCNSPLGYKVVEPCTDCLSSPNNGHYFMFSSPAVASSPRTAEPSLGWRVGEGVLSLGVEEDTFFGRVMNFQKELIAIKEENRKLAADLCEEKVNALIAIAEKAKGERADAIPEADLLDVLCYFQDHVPIAFCKRANFLSIVKGIKASKKVEWTKNLAQAFGNVLKGYRSAGNGQDSVVTPLFTHTPEDNDPSLFWST